MMEAYSAYQSWFYKHDDSGHSFEDHINSMTLYELMETLERWS